MNNKVLIIDDDVNILASFERNFRTKYKIVTAHSGEEGLEKLKEDGPFAVVIADYYMPGMNGVQFLSIAKQIAPDSKRIMFTGQADLNVSIDAINEGGIFRFLSKPCPMEHLEKILASAVEKYHLVISEKEMLEQSLKGSIKLLIDILSIVNNKTFSQATRLRKTAQEIAVRLKANNLWEIELAALFSQIGCVTIPNEILNKVYGGQPLTQEETEIYYSHPNAGKNLLNNIPRMEEIVNAIAYQYKQFDGSVQPGFVVIAIKREEITIGMVLADDIKDSSGAILISKGNKITDVLQMRLIVYARLGRIVEPIKVLEQI